MSSLTQMGLLHRTVAGRYRLGFKLLSLSQVLLSNTPWREVAQEELTALFGRYGETLHLAAFDGGQIVNVVRFPGRHPDSPDLPNVGAVLPAYQGGSGRVLLAHRPWTVVRRVLLEDEAANAHLEEAAQVLEQVVQGGLALYEDHAARTWSVAVPVHNHNSEVIAAISFTVPNTRSLEKKAALQAALLATGTQISGRIGYVASLQGEGQMVWLSVGGEEKLQGVPRRQKTRQRSNPINQ